MRIHSSLRLGTLAGAAFLAACGSNDDPVVAPVVPEETRAQDSRTFTPADPTATTFAAMAADAGDVTAMSSDQPLGGRAERRVLPGRSAAQLERQAGDVRTRLRGHRRQTGRGAPSIRRYLIQNGYAWAASSYSKNYYDVRVGVEDTNALALEFTKIAAKNARTLAAPTRTYITGHSMGGHITAAAIEDEAYATANNKVKYHGAVPMCGVMGDTELFNQFAAMQVTAQAMAGVPSYPIGKMVRDPGPGDQHAVHEIPVGTPTATGAKYLSVLQNITGGPRPMFDLGIAFGGSFPFGVGHLRLRRHDQRHPQQVLARHQRLHLHHRWRRRRLHGAECLGAEAHRPARRQPPAPDGLRWIPKVNGEFKIPVVSIHTLGDLFVPFSMQQVYQKRVAAKGNGGWLVQRAIRGASHCDFTVAEQVDAFDAMIKWERDGVKPAGDDVVTPATVAATSYGCKYTKNTLGPDDSGTTKALRPAILANSVPCPAS